MAQVDRPGVPCPDQRQDLPLCRTLAITFCPSDQLMGPARQTPLPKPGPITVLQPALIRGSLHGLCLEAATGVHRLLLDRQTQLLPGCTPRGQVSPFLSLGDPSLAGQQATPRLSLFRLVLLSVY